MSEFFTQMLKSSRNGKQVTVLDMARLSGLAVENYCDVENGRVKPDVETLRKITAVLGLTDNHLESLNRLAQQNDCFCNGESANYALQLQMERVLLRVSKSNENDGNYGKSMFYLDLQSQE